jgi:hypothetical protein
MKSFRKTKLLDIRTSKPILVDVELLCAQRSYLITQFDVCYHIL